MDLRVNARVGEKRYPVVIGSGNLKELERYLSGFNEKSIVIICDSYFNKPIGMSHVLKMTSRYPTMYIDGGIESKEFNIFMKIIEWLVDIKLAKDGVIIAIGGGVIGDIGAFVASTYLRGVKLVHVPTTTTAMIDSSIGGKTGINHLSQVNIIGSYYSPNANFMNISFLDTLSERDFCSGISEAIKMAITSDERQASELMKYNYTTLSTNSLLITKLVHWSILTKLKHVCDDEKEKDMRLVLNYGHTFGQAIESFYGLRQNHLRHGEAVALGMTIAAKLSKLLYHTKQADDLYTYTIEILKKYNLPSHLNDLTLPYMPTIDILSENLVNDKKRTSSGNRFILCQSIGEASIVKVEEEDSIKEAISSIF